LASMTGREIVDFSVELLLSKRGEGILIMGLEDLTDTADYFVLCTGNSDTQVKALADAVVEGMKQHGSRPWHVEGYEAQRWILIDFVDVVVHIFLQDVRLFYGLERLWGDAKLEWIQDEEDMENEKVEFPVEMAE